MLKFPLSQHLHVLDAIKKFIPMDRLITAQEILSFSTDQIQTLQTYTFYTFPYQVSSDEYRCLEIVAKVGYDVLQILQNGDVVIAPGDSPAKIINLINLLYRIGPNVYQDPNTGEEKTIYFLSFPLSALGRARKLGLAEEKLHQQYIQQILTNNEIALDSNFVYFDNISSGATLSKLNTIFEKIIGKPIQLQVLDLGQVWPSTLCQDVLDIMDGAEHTGSRCIPKYRISSMLPIMPKINLLRCNVFTTMVFLHAKEQLFVDLPEDLEIISAWEQFEHLEDNAVVKISYYNLNTLAVTSVTGVITTYDRDTIQIGNLEDRVILLIRKIITMQILRYI